MSDHGAVIGPRAAWVFYGGSVGEAAADVEVGGAGPVTFLRALNARLLGSGATVCAAAMSWTRAEWRAAWVGDCRVYRVREGVAERLSRDQTLAEQLAAEGIGASGAAAFVPLHRLGVREDVVIASLVDDVRPGDRLALATAGVWRDRTEASVLAALCLPDVAAARVILEHGPSHLGAASAIVDVPTAPR